MTTVNEHLAQGWKQQRAGAAAQAEETARRVLALDTANGEAFHLLGVALHARGKLAEAVEQYRKVPSGHPSWVRANNDLGTALAMQGHMGEAITVFRRVVEVDPKSAEAHGNLANALRLTKQLPQAISHFEEALRLNPVSAEACHNLGLALLAQGRIGAALERLAQALTLKPNFATALVSLQQALARQPDHAQAQFHLGYALARAGRLEEAEAAYRQALRLRPDMAEAHTNLGSLLCRHGRLEEGIACYQEAIKVNPNYAEAHFNLGTALATQGKQDEALACYEAAVRIKPDYADALNNMGNAYKHQRRIEEAIDSYRKALAAKPDMVAVQGNILLSLNCIAGYDPQAAFAEHVRWGAQFPPASPPPRDRDSERRLRLGYVSGDFREHVMGFYAAAVISAHDPSDFEIFCYANQTSADALTERIKSSADHWHSITTLSDEQAADQIRQDKIDLLIDLSGHTAGNRLGVFALRPAPVQIGHYGYQASTGLPAIDYRLTDEFCDPPGQTEHLHTERLVRLPVQWCYVPPSGPEVNPLPALQTKAITFGAFNNIHKLTDVMIRLWARILHRLPASALRILSGAGVNADERMLSLFGEEGIEPSRVTLLPRQKRDAYYRLYNGVDICLDTYPYAGMTTTADAVWMGVPVVNLAGPTCMSRQGISVLVHAGLKRLVTDSPAAYVEAAVNLAQDLPGLAELRAQLRGRLERSPLMDVPGFTRALEAAYRTMWQWYCKTETNRRA